MLTLPRPAGSSGAASLDGVWNAGAGSIVGWRVQQVLIGQQSTLAGRTGRVWGSVTIADGSLSQGMFTVDMAAITSGESQTTRQSVFDVSADPTATLVLTGPIALGALPADGAVRRYPATGALTMHGVTRTVRFIVSVERAGSSIAVLADINFPFANWNIVVQGVPFVADIQSPATVEVLLNLTQAQGNLASAIRPNEPSKNEQ
jgi:polyisoprenoid-binding protein YceI